MKCLAEFRELEDGERISKFDYWLNARNEIKQRGSVKWWDRKKYKKGKHRPHYRLKEVLTVGQ